MAVKSDKVIIGQGQGDWSNDNIIAKGEIGTAHWAYGSRANDKWDYVFRAKDTNKQKLIATKMKAICDNNHIGYNKYTKRMTAHACAILVNWEIKSITTNCYTTCGAAIDLALNAAGFSTGSVKNNKVVKSDVATNFVLNFCKNHSNLFEKFTSKDYCQDWKKLKAGDILICSGKHSAVVISTSTSSAGSEESKLTFKIRTGSTAQSNLPKPYFKNNNPFQVNTATGGNCTWYAWGRFWEVMAICGNSKYKSSNPWGGHPNGNACHWYSDAKSSGAYKTGTTPRPGAIICWGYYGKPLGEPGHVAFVEKVNYNKDGSVKSINISQSGWSAGPMKYTELSAGTGKQGTGAYKTGYNNSYFNGFIYNPYDVYSGDSDNGPNNDDPTSTGTGIDFQKRASILSSSDNHLWAVTGSSSKELSANEQLGNTLADKFKESLKSLNNINFNSDNTSNKLSESLLTIKPASLKLTPKIKKVNRGLYIADNVVESPFIEISLKGYKIGSYGGDLDDYPNYIQSLSVVKQNGVINQYNIKLLHQIRPSDDSNLLDELLSINNYDKINIKYGDCNSGQYFQDTDAIITNVHMTRNYTTNCMDYTLEATSAGSLVKTYTMNFKATNEKPSTVITNLFYENKITSDILLTAFPGMKNKEYVYSNNLIPTNDSSVTLKAQSNTNLIDYINYLVACMSNSKSGDNVVRDSTYYISYVDDVEHGSYINIKEITANLNPYGITDSIYDLTVGFNEDIIYDFKVDETNCWELLYKNSQKMSEYYYTIENNGDVSKYYSPTLSASSSVMSEINKNWWTQMIKFPVTATLTIKGLLSPVMLMDYININVVFYGQRHITSGVYAITGQTDSLSGSGYRTTLSLVRVSDNV